mgnify:CR=1 FL=1
MADEVTPIAETAQTEAPTEPLSASPEAETPVTEIQTVQMGGNEPLGSETESIKDATPDSAKAESNEVSTNPETKNVPESVPVAEATLNSAKAESGAGLPQAPSIFSREGARAVIAKAQEAIQFGKRKKLDRVMSLFAKRTNITNDEVEKLLHVSDATATRYLEILKKENKIKQNGKTGKSVSYSKI